MLTQRGAKPSFPNYSYGEKKFFSQRGAMAQWPPPKYATATAFSKYTCPGRFRKITFLPHHACSCRFALASCSPQNKFQDCYYHFQVSAVPTAILSLCLYSTVCADTITTIFFFIFNMCSDMKNSNGKVHLIV